MTSSMERLMWVAEKVTVDKDGLVNVYLSGDRRATFASAMDATTDEALAYAEQSLAELGRDALRERDEAHDALGALGVPSGDEMGGTLSLTARIRRLLAP